MILWGSLQEELEPSISSYSSKNSPPHPAEPGLGKATESKQPRELRFPDSEHSLSHTSFKMTTYCLPSAAAVPKARQPHPEEQETLRSHDSRKDPESPELGPYIPSPTLLPHPCRQYRWAVPHLLPKAWRKGDFPFPVPPIAAQDVDSEKVLVSLLGTAALGKPDGTRGKS